MTTPMTPDAPATPEEARAFAVWAEATNVRVLPFAGYALVACALLWWPLDRWVYAGQPETIAEFARLRAAIAVIVLPPVVIGPRVAWLRARPLPLAYTTAAAVAALLGWAMARSGPPEGPWLTYLALVPAIPSFVLASLRIRTVGTVAVSLAILAGYLAARPAAVGHPGFAAAASFLAFATLLGVAIGHTFYRVLEGSHLNRQRLAALGASLEERLAERTAELRRIVQHAEAVREEERRRIAGDLHDELGQELAAMRLAVAFTRSRGAPAAPLAELDRLLDRTHATVRHLLAGLRPRALDELGLAPAVHALCAETAARSGLAVRCVGDAPDLPPDVAVAAFRIVQEAVTNTLKHAQAATVEVSLARAADRLHLAVVDDGVGLSAEGHGAARGLGLLGIRERARSLGGSAVWEAGAGTRLVVEIPLDVPS